MLFSSLLPLPLFRETFASQGDASPGVVCASKKDQTLKSGKVIVVFIGAVSLEDLISGERSTIQSLINRGALGIMNVRTGGFFSAEYAYATIGAQDRAMATSKGGEAFVENEILETGPAGEIFLRRTGFKAPSGSVVVLDFASLLRVNSRSGQDPALGTLGSYLESQGKKGVIIGNADNDKPGREIALALMNKRGFLSAGQIGTEVVKADPERVYGIKTDHQGILQALLDYLPTMDCLFMETGDLSRLEKARDLILPDQKKRLKKLALGELDMFLRQLTSEVNLDENLLLLVSTHPSRESVQQGDTLTPVLALGPGFDRGLLYSASTRQPGIITLFDLQPTILSALTLETPTELQGRPLTVVTHPAPVGFLQAANTRIIRVNQDRAPILKGFVVVQIILIFSTLAVVLFVPKKPAIYRILRVLVAGITTAPLFLLLLPLINTGGVGIITLTLLFITISLGMLALSKPFSPPRLPGLVAMFTALALLVDTVNHSALMSQSVLGFSPVGGARYYGLGNEYLGILLGASITGVTVLLDSVRYKAPVYYACLLFFAACAYFSAAPWFGSNFGGGIALIVSYLLIILLLAKTKWSRRRLILTAVTGAVLIAVVLGLIDLMHSTGDQSHIGRFFFNIRQNGPKAAIPIILRKLRMNLKLLEYTIWTKAFLSFLIVLGVLSFRPSGKLAELAERYPHFFKGFWSVVVGSIVALFINDSGIVAAATSLLYPFMTLLSIVLADLGDSLGAARD